jgi:heterotetrameric sarcosine oxidase gamma subunit
MLGHVTSSYFSPTLGRSFALALVEAGGKRIGETLYATWGSGKLAPVLVTETDFLAAVGHVAEELRSRPMPEKARSGVPTVRHSPLAHREAISSGNGLASIRERKFIGKLIIRGDAELIGSQLQKSAGVMLPTIPCTTTTAGELTTLWLGPSEWMLLTPEDVETELRSTIAAALRQYHHQITDVSDHDTIIRAGGAKSREMLMKLTTLDLHPEKFPQGAVKGSVFGRVSAVMHCPHGATKGASDFDLIIRRSHADYLWRLLALAGREFGLPEQKAAGRGQLAAR